MDINEQKIQELERNIKARQTELSDINSQLSSKRSVLTKEQQLLDQSHKDLDTTQKLQKQGQSTLKAFEDKITAQKAINVRLEQFVNAKVAQAVARRSQELATGKDFKNTHQSISDALQDVGKKLKILNDNINSHQKNCNTLKSEISNLDSKSSNLKNRIIPQMQDELRRLRQQQIAGGGA